MPATAARPDPAALWSDAERLFAERKLDEAAATYRALAEVPTMAAPALVRLSMIASVRGQRREETEAAMAAFQTRTPLPQVLQLVGSRLWGVGEIRAVLDCALDPAVLEGGDAAACGELGRLLANSHFPREALQLLERARAGGFAPANLAFVIGLCRLYLGEDAAAMREFEAMLRRDPHEPQTLHALSWLEPPAEQDEARIERLRAAAEHHGAAHPQAPLLQYALFRELDRLDRRDDAWEALAEAMRLRRAQGAFDDAAEQALFDHLSGIKAPAPQAEGAEGPRPVFIVGMPGSGTSLLERILGHHDQVADAGELPDFVQQLRWCCDLAGPARLDLALAQAAEGIDFAELGKRYLGHTWWRGGDRAVYTDRTPSNFANVSYILRALPHARILHMVRSPMDTCFAGLSEGLPARTPPCGDQAEAAGRFRRYRSLMSHWRAQYPERILDVRYEELVADPDAVVRDVLAFCGLDWQDGVTDIAGHRGAPSAASDNQRPEPVHAGDIDRWRRYEQQLAPLREGLGALAY